LLQKRKRKNKSTRGGVPKKKEPTSETNKNLHRPVHPRREKTTIKSVAAPLWEEECSAMTKMNGSWQNQKEIHKSNASTSDGKTDKKRKKKSKKSL